MTVLIPRTRTISVRLSDEEFAALERYCVSSGARSISDLARNAMWGVVNRSSQESALASTVNEHSALVKGLEQKIEQLTAEIALMKMGRQVSAIAPVHPGGEASDREGTLEGLVGPGA